MGLLDLAVADNVAWCATVCPGTQDRHGVWLAGSPARPLFPDAITTQRGVRPEHVVELLADRPTCSVKDSYADCDLEPHGFTELFTARWIGRASQPAARSPDGWDDITSDSEFEVWCRQAGLPSILPDRVRHDARVLGRTESGDVVAGAILTPGDGAIGVSNVFGGRWAELVSLVGQRFPKSPIVGYERGADLADALSAGFRDLGPLRVWVR